jgi:hypothetical protein
LRCVYAIHHPAVFSILIAAANITSMISKKIGGIQRNTVDVRQGKLLRQPVVETFSKSLKAEML